MIRVLSVSTPAMLIVLCGCAGGGSPAPAREPEEEEFQFPRSKEADREYRLGKYWAKLARKALSDGNQFDAFRFTSNAIKSFESAASFAPDDPQIQIWLGSQYFWLGNHSKAILIFDQAIITLRKNEKLRPLLVTAMVHKLNSLFMISKVDEANAIAEEILKMEPHNQSALSVKQWCIEMKRPRESD